MLHRSSGPSVPRCNDDHGSGRVDEDGGAPTDAGPANRAVGRLVGTVALLAVTVLLATLVAVGASTWSLESGGPTAAFDLEVDGEESRVTIEHVDGETIDVTELSMQVAVNGDDLADQPPVPFVGAEGFDGAPEGPFNTEGDTEWRTGERAGLIVAETNEPKIEPGDTVTVTLVVDGHRVATLEATAS